MFSHIGFFHFATGHDKPIDALKAEITKHLTIANSLIVLPEAFNLGRPYSEPGPADIHRDQILADLGSLSRLHDITFVVGLMEPPPMHDEKPHSSSYLVDRYQSRLMCHKAAFDGIGYYTTCPTAPDHDNPVFLDDTTIVSVVCMDVDQTARCSILARRAKVQSKALNLICIPAAMHGKTYFNGAPVGHQATFCHSPDAYPARMILANSCADSTSSFITDTNLKVTINIPDDDRGENQLGFEALD